MVKKYMNTIIDQIIPVNSLKGTPLLGRLMALPANIRLGLKALPG